MTMPIPENITNSREINSRTDLMNIAKAPYRFIENEVRVYSIAPNHSHLAH
jgi:hypothetical protein